MDEVNDQLEKYWEKAEDILPGTNLGYIDIINGPSSSTVMASYDVNEDDDYKIYIVIDPEVDYSIEPDYVLFETVKKSEFKSWLKKYGLNHIDLN